ncbi:MAG TPA: hypothetical protein DCL43_12225 [Chitinophagaceae bacterium]|nr:hypothetical protein [Chitinophagaceae bacterium]
MQLSEQASIHLYRMMKEILTNTIKHAAQFEITYSDEGKGKGKVLDTSTILRETKGLGWQYY